MESVELSTIQRDPENEESRGGKRNKKVRFSETRIAPLAGETENKEEPQSRNTRHTNFKKRGTRIAPLEISFEWEEEKNKYEVFHMTFALALVAGLPFSPSMLSTGSRNPSKLVNTWATTMIILKTIWLLVGCTVNHLLWTSNALRAFFLLHCVAGYVISLILSFNRRKIANSIRELCYKNLTLNSTIYTKKSVKIFKIHFFLSILLFAVFYWHMLVFYYIDEYSSLTTRIRPYVPFSDDSAFYSHFNNFVLFSVIMAYKMSTLTLYAAMYICINAYLCSSRLLILFGEKFRYDIRIKSFTPVTASENTVLFKNTIFAINRMEAALGSSALVVYLAILNSDFNFLSVALSKDRRFYSFTVQMLNTLIILSASMMFFSLTLAGNTIPVQSKLLKKNLLELPDVVLKQSTSTKTVEMFDMLTGYIKASNPQATGFDLFPISKHLFPAFLGVFISYGTLLYQSGATEDS